MVYVLTMTFITALMLAFDSLIFSEDIRERVAEAELMTMLIGLATFFIVLIVAWLINYMVRFMLEKRSMEFGTYLLLGMKKKQIARLYIRENVLLGMAAFVVGVFLGIFLQQILMAVLCAMIRIDYQIRLYMNGWCILTAAGCYAGCYVLALWRCRRRFKKMNIHDLIYAGRRNEEVKEKHEHIKKYLLFVSVLFLLAFIFWLFFWKRWDTGTVLLFLIGLVLVIYLFYAGLASYIICYVRRKGNAVYQGETLFLLRQFSSKMKAMRFTMGTITALFTLAFLGSTVAVMLSDYQNKMLDEKFPFDVQVFSPDVEEDFAEELKVLDRETTVKDVYRYQIYENNTNVVNTWMLTHLRTFGTIYLHEDGTPNMEKIEAESEGGSFYNRYDTYMGITDYNYLRGMLGYDKVPLKEGEYLIHLKQRILDETGDFTGDIRINGKSGALSCAGLYGEGFSQDGHNGADYVIVVPDSEIEGMEPYYSELAADIEGEAPWHLQEDLDAMPDEQDELWYREMDGSYGTGSDTVINFCAINLVRDNLIPEVKYMLSSIVFPMFYIGLVFLCVALTVLSVQQLSDSAKYKFRYGVLKKLGMSRREISLLILKQLAGYYLCPVLLATLIGGIISLYLSRQFILYAGVRTAVYEYFGMSLIVFLGVYILYFITTYVGFRRNVDRSC